MGDQDYFSVSATAMTISKRGALAIYCGERPRKNEDGTTSVFMCAPLLLLPPDMFKDGDEVLRKVCALLNSNAHLFFDSAEPPADPVADLLRDAGEVLRQIDSGGAGGKVFDRDDCIKRLRASVVAMKGGAA